jgi:predicted RNA-binding protein (virulence factor B family)
MIKLGVYNILKVDRETPQGIYLSSEDNDEVLLPNRYVPEDIFPGKEIEVFVYKDSEDRPVATTQKVFLLLGEYAMLKVVKLTKFGAFMDWGLDKNLLVPFSEQNIDMEEEKSYPVYLYLDEETQRLAGSTRLDDFFDNNQLELEIDQEVDIFIFEETSLGYKVIVNNKYTALLYHNEIFQKIAIGDTKKAYVKKIREDNKVDVSLEKSGYSNIDSFAQQIMQSLENNMGFLALTDKTDADIIKDELQMSKKNFKKAIGYLYKNKKIELKKDGIYLC